MSNLDLALTLRLRNELSKGIGAVRGDLKGLRDEAARLAAAEDRPRAVRRAVRASAPRPPRRPDPQPDDFVEREGGIY